VVEDALLEMLQYLAQTPQEFALVAALRQPEIGFGGYDLFPTLSCSEHADLVREQERADTEDMVREFKARIDQIRANSI